MNTVFNITRFGNLMKKEAIASWRFYLYIILGVIAFFIMAIILEEKWPLLKISIPPLYMLFVICVAPMIDRNMSVQNVSFYLSLPVSKFERWLLLWLKAVIILPLILTILVYIFNEISPIIGIGNLNGKGILKKIYMILSLQSIFFFAFIYSRKRIVPIIALVAFLILIYAVSNIIINTFYPEISTVKSGMDPFYIWDFDGYYYKETANGKYHLNKLETTMIYDTAKYVVKAIFPLGMWVLSYIRLKETEA